MSPDALAVALIVLGYLAGSVPFGVLVARRRGVDIQKTGSGNIGATNVARTLGTRLGVLVLALDAAKGAVPVLLSRALDPWPHLAHGVALAAVVGHCFPVWLRFRGGKGVATALGVFLVLDPLSTAASGGVFVLVYATSRMASLASLSAAVAFPIVLWLREQPLAHVVLALAVAAVIVVQHRENLRRLARGEERQS